MSDTTKELPELRQDLLLARRNMSQCVKLIEPLRRESILAKTAYQRALAKAKVMARAQASTAADRQPTMINAVAELDGAVIAARDDYDIKLAKYEQAECELKNLDDEIKAIKKAMSTIEAEMRSFGG